MNLRVNLLADDEFRSPSPVRIKALLPFLVIAVILLMIFFAVMTVIRHNHISTQLKTTKWRWERMEHNYRVALDEAATNEKLKYRLDSLNTYQNVRIPWHSELRKLITHTPTNVQLTELHIAYSTSSNTNTPARTYSMRVQGRADRELAEATVRTFLNDLGTHPDFTNIIISASIPAGSFRDDNTVDAPPNSRIFEINCGFNKLTFK